MVCSVTCTWTQTATGYTDLKSYGVLSGSDNNAKLEACKEKCKYDSQCNGVTIKNSDYSCWTETFTVNSGDAPGNTYTTYLKSNCQGAYPLSPREIILLLCNKWQNSNVWSFYCLVLDNSRKKRELYAMENDETSEFQRYKRAGKYDQ